MAKNKKPAAPKRQADNGGSTLADLLKPELARKLKEASASWKAEEEAERAAKREQAERERQEKEKQLEQNFEHLLGNSKLNWRDYK